MRNNTEYERALEQLQSEFEEIVLEEHNVRTHLKEVRERKDCIVQAISGLEPLLGINTTMGLSDAVRQLFSDFPEKWLAPITIRDNLQERGFPINRYTQPLPVIHTTLRRLVKQEELESKGREGKTRYHLVEK